MYGHTHREGEDVSTQDHTTHHDVVAELKDLCKLIAHGLLQVFRLHLSHLTTGEVKHLFTEGEGEGGRVGECEIEGGQEGK